MAEGRQRAEQGFGCRYDREYEDRAEAHPPCEVPNQDNPGRACQAGLLHSSVQKRDVQS